MFVFKPIYLYSLWENVFSLCRTDKIENIQSIDIAKKKEKRKPQKITMELVTIMIMKSWTKSLDKQVMFTEISYLNK